MQALLIKKFQFTALIHFRRQSQLMNYEIGCKSFRLQEHRFIEEETKKNQYFLFLGYDCIASIMGFNVFLF